MNCRRRCGLGNFKCGWNSNCGGLGCRAARPNYQPNTNGMNWRYRNNGQYWGAAAQWNSAPIKGQIQISEDLVQPSEEIAEEKPCTPELPNSGEYKWVAKDKDWKWVCNDKTPEEGSVQKTVIEA